MNTECFLKTRQSKAWQRKRKELGLLADGFSLSLWELEYTFPRKPGGRLGENCVGLCSLPHLNSLPDCELVLGQWRQWHREGAAAPFVSH